MPVALRLLIVFLLGLGAGAAINWAIYALAWNRRLIGPWSTPHEDAPPRHGFDYVPVLGWWGLRRESPLHGRGYWVRPMLLELLAGAGFAALCWWEIDQLGLRPPAAMVYPPAMVWQGFIAHFVLMMLLTATTFIDFDEKTVPDAIIAPGTLAGLLLAALLPASHLPVLAGQATAGDLLLTSPSAWPVSLDGPRGLAVGAACLACWCAALLPVTWTTRRGFLKAFQYLFARVFRGPTWKLLLATMLIGWGVIFLVWMLGGSRWQSLLSALVGMAGGGALVWGVRIVGGLALRREAMGFGDVTLMAMIGAYLGWQSALITFFLSPFAALIIAVSQWLITGRKDIAFVPYLSLAAVMLIVGWRDVWRIAGPNFAMGWLVPALVVACLLMMGGMLSLMRICREAVFGPD